MRTPSEIRRSIREHKADMRTQGIPVRCSMNRMEIPWVRANTRLEALKLELEAAVRQ